jgi:hypothetical protein
MVNSKHEFMSCTDAYVHCEVVQEVSLHDKRACQGGKEANASHVWLQNIFVAVGSNTQSMQHQSWTSKHETC